MCVLNMHTALISLRCSHIPIYRLKHSKYNMLTYLCTHKAHTQVGHIVSHTLASIFTYLWTHKEAHAYVHTCTLTHTHMLMFTSMLQLRPLRLHSHYYTDT